MSKSYIQHTDGSSSFVGDQAVSIFVCYVNAAGLRAYAKSGMKPSRVWTVTGALDFVHRVTGMKFKRTQLVEAAQWLTIWANAKRYGIPEISTRAMDIANQYATIRWMLNDPTLIKEQIEGLHGVEIFDAIDQLAEDYELIDPFTDAGVMMSREERDERQAAIVTLRVIVEEACR